MAAAREGHAELYAAARLLRDLAREIDGLAIVGTPVGEGWEQRSIAAVAMGAAAIDQYQASAPSGVVVQFPVRPVQGGDEPGGAA